MDRNALISLVFVFLFASFAHAQICPPNAPTELNVTGRIIAPGVTWDSYVEVLQLDETRLVGYAYTNSSGQFRLPPQPKGQYYIVVRLDGFKDYRERIDVFGCDAIYPYTMFLEPADEVLPPVILDFTGEVKEVVDITELMRKFPKNAVDEFQRARADRLRGDPARARRRLEAIVNEAPDFYDAHNALGSVYLEMKMFREAELEYNKAHDLNPGSAAPLVSLGSLYVQEAEASTNPEPGVVGVLLLEGDLALILDDARSVLQEALKLKPDASFAHYLLGIAYYKAADYEKAEASLKQALMVEPRLRWARMGLANVYMRQNRWTDALEELDIYLKEFPRMSNRPEVETARKKVAQQLAKPSE